MPRNIWKMKTIAVAPYAAPFVPMDSKTDASMKHTDSPEAEVMSRARRPKRSTV